MTRDDQDRFLSRWSRLKKEARQTEEKPPQAEANAAPPPAVEPSAPVNDSPSQPVMTSPAAVPQLPPLDTLKGLASEYSEFLKPGVDEGLRRSALKKLFADPYFETFERFEAYCEDYTQGEPIPAAMLRTLEHAKGLLFDEKDEKKEQERGVADGGKPQSEARAIPAQAETKVEAPVETPRAEDKS